MWPTTIVGLRHGLVPLDSQQEVCFECGSANIFAFWLLSITANSLPPLLWISAVPSADPLPHPILATSPHTHFVILPLHPTLSASFLAAWVEGHLFRGTCTALALLHSLTCLTSLTFVVDPLTSHAYPFVSLCLLFCFLDLLTCLLPYG